MSGSRSARQASAPLEGGALLLACLVAGLANFMAVLDVSIVNVALPHVAASLAAAPNESTSVITYFAVAEAISILLTGWLAERFGTVRVFLVSIAGFGVASVFCGLAQTLPMLVFFRVLQGLCAGPMMPLSQALLTQTMPNRHYAMAIALWSMTIVIAPIGGPMLGGLFADSVGWEWAFFVNAPFVAFALWAGRIVFAAHETPKRKRPIDFVGLALLVLWVGALQFMLEEGGKRDWFESPLVLALLAVTIVSFAAFLIWELTDAHPIVDLRVFRHLQFTVTIGVTALGAGAFFASIVLFPLWLQTDLGLTATWAGYLTALSAVIALFTTPVTARLVVKADPRALIFVGLVGLAAITALRAFFNSWISFEQMALVQLAQGAIMPLFFIPLMVIAFDRLNPREIAGAAGILTFARIAAGAIGASLAVAAWEDAASAARAELVGGMANGAWGLDRFAALGLTPLQTAAALGRIVDSQSVMLATNYVFGGLCLLLLAAATFVWLAPSRRRAEASVKSKRRSP